MVRTVGQFNELYFVSELSVEWTSRLPNMVQTVWRTILRFLTDFLMRCKLQPKPRCAGCTQTRVYMLIHSQPKALTMDAMAVPGTHLFISLYLLGPTDNADPPIHKWSHFLQSERLKTFMLSAMYCCLSFFLFHTRALRFQPIRRKVRWTQRTVPRTCRAKCFGPQTQLCRSSSNCSNWVREVKVCPIKNELSSPNPFQVRQTPRTRFMKQMFIQLRMGLRPFKWPVFKEEDGHAGKLCKPLWLWFFVKNDSRWICQSFHCDDLHCALKAVASFHGEKNQGFWRAWERNWKWKWKWNGRFPFRMWVIGACSPNEHHHKVPKFTL